jgi:hypothetical protein
MVVVSIETYEKLEGEFELNKLLDEGIEAVKENKVKSSRTALNDIQKNS